MLGGVDFRGPHLFTIYPHGSTDSLPYCTMGSGSLNAMAVFEVGGWAGGWVGDGIWGWVGGWVGTPWSCLPSCALMCHVVLLVGQVCA